MRSASQTSSFISPGDIRRKEFDSKYAYGNDLTLTGTNINTVLTTTTGASNSYLASDLVTTD